MPVGKRIYLKKPEIGRQWTENFAQIPTANIADTMERSCALHARIRLFSHPIRNIQAGIALTVKSRGGDNLLIHAALDMAQQGDVIIVSNEGGGDNRSLMGEVMFRYALYKKVTGIIADGPIRDVESAENMTIPIYASGVTPGGPYKEGPGEINVPISCGGISIMPGDIIVMDRDGAIVIPLKDAEEVLKKSIELQKEDREKAEKSGNGTADRQWVSDKLKQKGIAVIDGFYDDGD